ncbi:MAG: hypothetical protein ABSH09_07575 [Bryobacteraceae bacterium]|jgi:hypothetical protein
MTADKQHAHDLLDRIPADQIVVAVRFLEFLLLDPVNRVLATAPLEDEQIGEEEEQAVARSKEWFKHNEGIPFEQVAADLGFKHIAMNVLTAIHRLAETGSGPVKVLQGDSDDGAGPHQRQDHEEDPAA